MVLSKCVTCFAVLLIGSNVNAATTADTSEQARALIERAIEAQGGREQVAKLFKSWHAIVEGTAGPLRIHGPLAHAGAERGRMSTQIEIGEKRIEVVVVTNGDRTWRTVDGKTQEVTGNELKEMQDGGWRSRKVRFLLPLVTEKGIELSILGASEVAKRPAVGVLVRSKGHRDVEIFFDKETGHLVKMQSRITAPDKKEIVLEQIFSDYADFDGVKIATTFTKFENGRQTSIEHFKDVEFVKEIDPKLFAKP